MSCVCLVAAVVLALSGLVPQPARADADEDALYWLAPALVEALPAPARSGLTALAGEVVAGRTAPLAIDAAVAQVLASGAGAPPSQREWLQRYVAWELHFLAGDFDLAPATLQALVAQPCCGTEAQWRERIALEAARRARVTGLDAEALVAPLLPTADASSELLAVLAMADLDRGHTPAARARLETAAGRCGEGCVPTPQLLLAQARAAFFAAHFTEASALVRRSLQTGADAPRRDWLGIMPGLADLIELCSELKETDKATSTFDLARTRADALLAQRHPYALDVAVADFMASVEDYESGNAAQRHDAIVARFGTDLNELAPAVMELRIDESAMQWLRNEYAPARAAMDAAIPRIEAALGNTAPQLADALIVRALACSGLNDYDCVLSSLQHAQSLREGIYAFPHPLIAEAENNLAVNLHDLGRYDLAEPLMRSVLDIDRAYYGQDNEEVASDIHNLASLYRAMGDTGKAVPLLQEALAIDERELGPKHARTGIMLNGLGQAYLEAGDWQHAFDALQRSAEIQAAVDPMSRGVPIARHNEAEAALELGRPELARDLITQALVRYEDPKVLDWRKAATAHRDLARAYTALGRNDDAERELGLATRLAPRADAPEVLWRTYMAVADDDTRLHNPRSAVFFGKLALEVLQALRSRQSTLARPLQTDFLKARADSYRRVVAWLVDLGRLAEAHVVRAMLGDEEYYEFTRRLRAASTHDVPFTPFESEQRKRLQAAWDAVHEQRGDPDVYGDAVAQVRAAFAALDTAHDPPRSAVLDRATPPEAAAYLDYVVGDERTTVIALTARGRYSANAAIARSALRARVFELREALASPQGKPEALAAELYRTLVQPVAAALAGDGVRTLWVSGDDVLRYLPFPALRDGADYLGQRYAIASMSPFAAGAHAATAPEVAAFAVSQSVGGYPALPAAQAEVEAIVRTDARDSHGQLPGRIWLNEAFDRKGLRAALGAGYDIVHVASHFQFEPGNETDSFLLLGTGERLPLSELRTGDYPLDKVDLLTMSGCDTVAASEDADGREIDGFAALAASKGARYVLATLWSIDDEETAALMSRFYGALAGGADPVAALSEARRAFMDKHPFYWAPFVLWGTPGAH